MIKKLNFILLSMLIFSKIYTENQPATNLELFENKNIVILGGTGYLGRAILTEVLKYNPSKVTVFSRDEVKHFNIAKLFDNNPKIQSVIGDIRDYTSLVRVTKNADIVFHVAALKRIDTLELNIEECIKTNVVGTLNVFNACIENNVDKVIFISTDKACSPINTYGACKFVSEKIFNNYDTNKIKTKFIGTRFGNILESTGSIIPIFTEKIKNGQDIPLTDDRMTRFIISKEEAVDLMLNALRYGIGGEIFVKNLTAMKITDLIEILKTKYNGTQSNIKVIGIRPGEKIHEMLINESEMERTYAFDDYFVIIPTLQSWIPNDENYMPVYIKRDLFAHKSKRQKYSSDEAILSLNDLEKTLTSLGMF